MRGFGGDRLLRPRAASGRVGIRWIVAFAVLALVFVAAPWLAGRAAPWATQADTAAYESSRAALERVLEHRYGYDPRIADWATSIVQKVDDAIARGNLTQSDVDEAVIRIDASIRTIESQRADWALEYGATPENLVNDSGTEAEAALDMVSGGAARFEIGDCGPDDIACVWQNSTVTVPLDQVALTDDDFIREQPYPARVWIDIMRHEYMHVLQAKLGDRLAADTEYLRLFDVMPDGGEDYDVGSWAAESSAECMAQLQDEHYVASYPVYCTDEQFTYARWILDEALSAD